MTTAIYCGECGTQVEADARFCVRCGTEQEPIEDLFPTAADSGALLNGRGGEAGGDDGAPGRAAEASALPTRADVCPACDARVAPGQRTCRSCGTTLAAPDDPWIGVTLGQYRVERVIARGGMGVVYHAFDERLERSVALKLLREDLTADDRFRLRFVSESRAAAALDHPNILPVFDAGETQGILYLATRLVDGLDLRRLMAREGTLAIERALHIAGQIGAALDLAHSRGLVHRDVKPANILLVPAEDPNHDHAYLIDFGISKLENADAAHTGTGEFIGTAAYAAPEQIEGERIDGRADQYALACVLFECLTGTTPFQSGTAVDMLHAHLHAPPPHPGRARAGIPESLDLAVVRALEKNPARRFETNRAFLATARAGRTRPRSEPQPATPGRTPATVGQNRMPAPVVPPPMPAASASGGRMVSGALIAALLFLGGGLGAVLVLRAHGHSSSTSGNAQHRSALSAGSAGGSQSHVVRKTVHRVQQTFPALDVSSIPTNTLDFHGYSIDLPDWNLVKNDEKEPSPAGVTRRRTQVVDSSRGLSVIVDHLTGFGTPAFDNRAALDRAYARSKPGYRRIGFNDYSLGGQQVYEWRFRFDDNGGETRRVDLLLDESGDSFGVEATGQASYDDLAALARSAAQSIVITAGGAQ